MTTESTIDTIKKSRTTNRLKDPGKFKVVLCNDDVTPVDFVIALLIKVFKHDTNNAISLTLEVHEKGSGVAGIFPYEVAEQKSIDATNMARANNFPLIIKVEPE
jgi:ATP-dependent Clp protease adaptor protein ClpS